MPKIAKELSALAVNRLRESGLYAVGGVAGLCIQVTGPAKSWILRVTVASKRRKIGLGSYPVIDLATARANAREMLRQISEGIDPVEMQRQAKQEQQEIITFDKACKDFIAMKSVEWKNAKHRQQWENTLSTYAYPVIGQLSVGDVDQSHILKILEPIWLTKTDTAKRLRGRIEMVLEWAKVRKYRTGDNPARWAGHLDHLLPRPSKVRKRRHHPAVPYENVQQAVTRIANVKGISAQALLFTILTAARSTEIFGCTWSEIDFKNKLWIVPAERMKSGRVHRVPLSDQAMDILNRVPRLYGCEYVFASRKNGKLSNMAMVLLMRRLNLKSDRGEVAVPHGFRSSFRDWAGDCTNFAGDVAEMALAHVVEDETEAAYRRGDMLQKRRALMQQWGDYCFGASVSEP